MREARSLTEADRSYAGRVLNSAFSTPKRTLRMTPDERRAALIATTVSLLGSRPLSEISPELIAREAGVSRALFYRYFSGLDEAYTEAFRTITGILRTSLENMPGGTLREQLDSGLGAFLDFASAFREAYIAIFTLGAGTAGGSLAGLVEDVRQTIMTVVTDRSGAEDTPVFELTVRSWMSATEVAVLRWLEHQPMERAEIQRWLIEQLVAMMTVSAANDATCARVLDTFANPAVN
jgi:AcrR family transcriptional regulator